jgi:Kef-type K+ transport system membrane component KefB
MRTIPERDRWYAGLIWLALCGFAADWAGLHFMVGAFLSGAVLDADMFNQKEMDQFRHNILLAIMPVFFLSTGLRTNWDVGGAIVFGAAALLLVASVSGKLIGVHVAGKLLKSEKGEATIVGWLLQTKALIMIIFVSILLDKGIITNEAFTTTLLMALGSTMLSIPMVAPRLVNIRDLIFKIPDADSKKPATPSGALAREGAPDALLSLGVTAPLARDPNVRSH